MRAAVIAGAVALAVCMATTTGAAAHGRRAVSGSAAFPSWSPDGKQVAFVYDSSTRYRIVRTSSRPGGAVHTVSAARGYCCEQLQWAAGGRILANPQFRLNSVGVPSGTAKRLFFPSCGSSGCQTMGFILSPNREYAAAAITDFSDPHANGGIGLVKLRRGREPAVLSSPLSAEESAGICEPPPQPCGGFLDSALTFSPDSTQLVFSRAIVADETPGPSTLRAISLAGGGSVPLAQSGIPGASLVPDDAAQVQWSPDGRWVAYVEDNPYGIQDLAVVPTTGGAPRYLATCRGNSDFRFSWSPTSKLLAYTHHCQTALGRPSTQFTTVRPDGTHGTNLLKGGRFADVQGTPQWSPDGARLLFVAPRLFPGGSSKISYVWTIRANGRGLTRLG